MNWQDRNETAISIARETNGAGRRWYVLRIDSQRISKAIPALNDIGCVAFAPTEERSRRMRGSRTKSIVTHQPIMTGYAIAGLGPSSPSWFGIFSLPFVFGVVSRDGAPAIIPHESMARCFKIHQTASPHLPGSKSLRPGDMIRVTDGGFRGHEAQLLDIKDGHCEFIVNLFGKDHKVRRPIMEVEAA